MRSFRGRALLAAAAAGLCALSSPAVGADGDPQPPADGGIAFVTPAPTAEHPEALEVRVLTRPGEVASDLSLNTSASVVVLNDHSGEHLIAGPGCRQVSSDDDKPLHRVACERPEGKLLSSVLAALGGGKDFMTIEGSGPDWTVDLGDGDDAFSGPKYGPGNEPIVRVAGGAGNDDITVKGKNGIGRGDAGDDRLHLKGSDGTLIGGAGTDILDGTGGYRGKLSGGVGDDTLIGTNKDDVLTGGPGVDFLFAKSGADRIYVRDSTRDRVTCGLGEDLVSADGAALDAYVPGCERVLRPRRR